MGGTTYISFPGLGIEEFAVSKTAFTLFAGTDFERSIAWYALIIMVGIVLAVLYSGYRARQEGMDRDSFMDLALFTVIAGILGARLYYVVMEWDQYLVTGQGFWENLKGTLGNIVSVWNGGLAIYGGVICGGLAVVLVCRYKKIGVFKILDAVAPAVMIGQLIGRWGNFINGEAYGYETTLPWRMGVRHSVFAQVHYYHPTFFYESLWNLIGFLILHFLYGKKKFDGQIFAGYIAWYGLGRFFIEGLRTDSLYAGPFRVSQLVAAASVIAGVAIMVIFSRKAKSKNEMTNATEELTEENNEHGKAD